MGIKQQAISDLVARLRRHSYDCNRGFALCDAEFIRNYPGWSEHSDYLAWRDYAGHESSHWDKLRDLWQSDKLPAGVNDVRYNVPLVASGPTDYLGMIGESNRRYLANEYGLKRGITWSWVRRATSYQIGRLADDIEYLSDYSVWSDDLLSQCQDEQLREDCLSAWGIAHDVSTLMPEFAQVVFDALPDDDRASVLVDAIYSCDNVEVEFYESGAYLREEYRESVADMLQGKLIQLFAMGNAAITVKHHAKVRR